MKLEIPRCYLDPQLEKIQEKFNACGKNVIETFYAVTAWGWQAKTTERNTRKPLLEEVRYEHNFFPIVNEHKETIRVLSSMTGGLATLQPYVDKFLKHVYKTECFLWADTMIPSIDEFVATRPLNVDIRDQFIAYDAKTSELINSDRMAAIGPIVIKMDQAYEAFIAYSKVWKVELGSRLIASYKKNLDEMVTFIKDQEFSLARPLRDLDDVRVAMICLDLIRERSIE